MPSSSKKIVSIQSLKRKIRTFRQQGKRIAFTNGCFDILHYGHVSYLEAAKKDNSRVLIIGLNSDKSVRSLNKGSGRPIVPQAERAKVLAALSCVDHLVIFNEPTPQKLIEALKPDILIKGADWKDRAVAGADVVKKVELIRYIKGLSTTNIIQKIKTLCEK